MICKVTEVTKVKFGFWSITQLALTINLKLGRHLSRVRDDAYSFILLSLGVDFRVTECNKVKIV